MRGANTLQFGWSVLSTKSMADPPKPQPAESVPQPAGLILGKYVVTLLLVAAVGFGAALVGIAMPQDLSDIGGYGPVLRGTPARDLKPVLANSLERGYPVTLSEAEINQWLGRTLIAKQGGLLAKQVSLDRVLVRLEDDYAEVVMLRRILGRAFTVSMFLKIEQSEGLKGVQTEVQLHGGPYVGNVTLPPRGGRFGRLVVPQGFLLLVMPAYEDLAELFAEEIRLGFQEMARIQIEDGRLLLNPRAPSENLTTHPATLPQSF